MACARWRGAVLVSGAAYDAAVWRLESAAGTLAAYIDGYAAGGDGERLLGVAGAGLLADYRQALAAYEAAAGLVDGV